MIKRTLAFERMCHLSLRNDQIVVRYEDKSEKTVAIEDTGILILESMGITLTNALLSKLVENQVAVITCDERHMPVGLLMPLEGHSLQSARFQAQFDATVPLKKQVWAQLVKSKIENQGRLLELLEKPSEPLFHWAVEVRSGDPDNLEARAAAFYWPLLFGNPNFRRDRNGQAPNPMLNYGYAILRAIVARALVASGLLPLLGVHHKNQYNAYCLADDVMEPYRPFIDAHIVCLIASHGEQEEITREWKIELLKIPTLDVSISNEKSPLLVAVSKTTASLARIYEGAEKRLQLPAIKPGVI